MKSIRVHIFTCNSGGGCWGTRLVVGDDDELEVLLLAAAEHDLAERHSQRSGVGGV